LTVGKIGEKIYLNCSKTGYLTRNCSCPLNKVKMVKQINQQIQE